MDATSPYSDACFIPYAVVVALITTNQQLVKALAVHGMTCVAGRGTEQGITYGNQGDPRG
ncbi:MAG: hypothetical protein QNJ03_00195 [Dinoroseobacter sp.]|nr:hypothetical protein [Dinoroseobacter sp.]